MDNFEEFFESTKPKTPLPKNGIFIGALVLVCLSMIGGIVVLNKTGSRRGEIRMKVMQSYATPPLDPSFTPTPGIPTPTIDPTATWKTYRTKSYMIKYPERFTITEQKPQFSIGYPIIYSSIVFTDVQSNITITVARNTPNYSLDTLLGKGPSIRYTKELVPDSKVTRKKVGNADSLFSTDIPTGGNGTAADVLLISNNKVYQITLSPRATDMTTFSLILDSFVILNDELPDVTETWKLYADSIYGYSFKYPTTYTTDFIKTTASTSAQVIVYDTTKSQIDTPKWKIEVQDPKNFGQSAITSRDLLKLSLEEYVNKKWEYNKSASDSAYPNRKVGPIQTTAIGTKQAYQFTVTDKYVDDHVFEKLSEEYIFVFTESAGYKYKIWYPKSNAVNKQITDTITFFK